MNLVQKTESQGWEDFEGEVVDVMLEEPKEEGYQSQWHILMKPLNRKMKKEGSYMHEWVRQTSTTTDTSVPQGSVISRFVEELEMLHGKQVKDLKTVAEVFNFMKGKKYLFKQKVLGQSFNKNPASAYWTPVKLL
jgi:hypothetical protein